MNTFHVLLYLALCLGLAGCASTSNNALQQSLQQPFNDLNLNDPGNADGFFDALLETYPETQHLSCIDIQKRMENIDQWIGAELPMMKMPWSLQEELEKQVKAALNDAIVGWIPMRHWIRRLSGAEKKQNKQTLAVLKNQLQRAYFRGVYQTRCKKEVAKDYTEHAIVVLGPFQD